MKNKKTRKIESMDTKLQNVQYDLEGLEEDLRLASISGKQAAKRLELCYGKIESVRVLLNDMKNDMGNTEN